jgi:hypothetical protein
MSETAPRPNHFQANIEKVSSFFYLRIALSVLLPQGEQPYAFLKRLIAIS